MLLQNISSSSPYRPEPFHLAHELICSHRTCAITHVLMSCMFTSCIYSCCISCSLDHHFSLATQPSAEYSQASFLLPLCIYFFLARPLIHRPTYPKIGLIPGEVSPLEIPTPEKARTVVSVGCHTQLGVSHPESNHNGCHQTHKSATSSQPAPISTPMSSQFGPTGTQVIPKAHTTTLHASYAQCEDRWGSYKQTTVLVWGTYYIYLLP